MQLNWETRLLLVCRLGTGCSVPVEPAITWAHSGKHNEMIPYEVRSGSAGALEVPPNGCPADR